jgi:hypothetical protein
MAMKNSSAFAWGEARASKAILCREGTSFAWFRDPDVSAKFLESAHSLIALIVAITRHSVVARRIVMSRNWIASFAAATRICCILLFFVFSGPASGAIFTGPQVQSFSLNDLNSSANLNFNGFDSSLGTLTGVQVTLTINETLTSQVFNSTGVTQAIGNPTGLSATATTTTTGPAGLSLITTLTTGSFTGNVSPGLTNLNTASLTNQISQMLLNSPPTDLSSYIGRANSVAITVGSQGTQGGSVPSGVFSGNTGTANGTVAIAYSYISQIEPPVVPEPASMAIWSLGALGCAIAGYRRRKLA